ncbi:MAG: GNAT family N-acetyltransferase [Saprospiraceae bacterium]|nr:GNAT family N-acetyltransferase [Saprospiraceae bacterium]
MSAQRSQAIEIKESNIETVVALSQQIPEFIDPHGAEEYHRRLTGVRHLILVAFVENKPVGFKVGYEREGYFYSWMGGVLQDFRQMAIAKALADEQEAWAKKSGYTTITFKTRNSHKGMLIFALKNGFDIIGFEPSAHTPSHRILLRKQL